MKPCERCGNPNGIECQTEWASCDARAAYKKNQEPFLTEFDKAPAIRGEFQAVKLMASDPKEMDGKETPQWLKDAFPEDFPNPNVVETPKGLIITKLGSEKLLEFLKKNPPQAGQILLKEMDEDVAEILGRIIDECDLKADPDLRGTFEYDYKLIVSSLIQYRNDLESLVDAVRDCGLAVSRGEEIRKRRSWP